MAGAAHAMVAGSGPTTVGLFADRCYRVLRLGHRGSDRDHREV